jgi:hypothetical protein
MSFFCFVFDVGNINGNSTSFFFWSIIDIFVFLAFAMPFLESTVAIAAVVVVLP